MNKDDIIEYGYVLYENKKEDRYKRNSFTGIFKGDMFLIYRTDGKFIGQCNTVKELQETEMRFLQSRIDKYTQELIETQSAIDTFNSKR